MFFGAFRTLTPFNGILKLGRAKIMLNITLCLAKESLINLVWSMGE